MYREMRRKDRELDEVEAMRLLEKAEYGVLSTVGEDGQPYGVPLSYAAVEREIYFHCAVSGQKLDNIAHEPRVSFAVVGDTQPVFESDNYSTYFESAVVFGRVSAVTDEKGKRAALIKLVEKYFPADLDRAETIISAAAGRTAVYKLSVEHITGKAKKRV